jgi:hypothetical protein
VRSGCTIRWPCVLRLQPPPPSPRTPLFCAPLLFHLLSTPPCNPRHREEPNAVCTLSWKWKCLQSCHFCDTRFTWRCALSYILYELFRRVVPSLPVEINTNAGNTIGNALPDKIITWTFLNQTQISEWSGQKREFDSRLGRRKVCTRMFLSPMRLWHPPRRLHIACWRLSPSEIEQTARGVIAQF